MTSYLNQILDALPGNTPKEKYESLSVLIEKAQLIDSEKKTAEELWDWHSTGIPEDDYAGAEGIAEMVAGKSIMYKDDFLEAFSKVHKS